LRLYTVVFLQPVDIKGFAFISERCIAESDEQIRIGPCLHL
jgi:hypothetical protein